MKRMFWALAGWGLLLSATGQSKATFFVYTTRAAFDAANPGLPVEDFEKARVAATSSAFIFSLLSSTTSNSVFSPGDILPGLTVSTLSGFGLLVLGTGDVTGTTKAVGSFHGDDNLTLTFPLGVSAVGTDFFAAIVPNLPGPAEGDTFLITVSGAGGFLGLATAFELAGHTTFIGVSDNTELITGLKVEKLDPRTNTFVDNVAFGSPSVASAVPEPASITLLGIGLTGLAGCFLRRRKKVLAIA